MKIFISAVTSEFGKARDALRSDLRARGHEVVVQSDFQQSPDSEMLLGTLADYIRDCHAVICVVGKRAGAAPPARAAERLKDVLPREIDKASYTQWEFFLARHYRRRPYVYLAKDDYAPDKDAAGDDTALQDAFAAYLKAEGVHYTAFSTADELRIAVMRDEPKIAADPAPTQRTVTKPIVLPYPSLDHLFKGREGFMQQLHESLRGRGKAAITGTRQALYGLGGVGKTRAAVEYAWAHQDDYSALLFVVAETPEALRANLVALTAILAPHLKEAPDEERRAAVLDWLRSNPGWLLILDNVDSKPALTAVEDLLKDLHGGQVIVTSRLSDFSANFAPLPLDVLPLDDAVAFLLERTEGRRRNAADDKERAREIATEVDRLALALEQAAAYIAKRRLTFAAYLEQWRAADHSKVLDWFDETVTGYKRAVAVTWQTSVTQLTEAGRRLLERLAWLAPEPVPEFLLDVPIPGAENDNLHYALSDLTAYSLVTRDAERPFFLVHRLVQDVTRRRLASKAGQRYARNRNRLMGKFKGILDQPSMKVGSSLFEAVGWITVAFGGNHYNVHHWPRLESLAPHARTVPEYAAAFGIAAPGLVSQLGWFLHAKGLFTEAEPLMRRALADNETYFGLDDPRVAIDLNNLAQLLHDTNRLAEAELLMRRALAIGEKNYGLDHPDSVIRLSNLAVLLKNTDRFAEAEPLLRRVVSLYEKISGPDHADVATPLNNLASLLGSTSRFGEAEPLLRRAVNILENFEDKTGQIHPTFARALNNLAALLRDTKRHDEAEPLMRRALTINETIYGLDHPNVAVDLYTLGKLLRDTNRLAEAEPLLRRALSIDEASFGPDHFNVATVLSCLGSLLQDSDRLAEAELVYRRALAIDEKSFGSNHHNVAIHLSNLAGLLKDTNRLAEAAPLMRRHVAILVDFSRATGHPHTHLEKAFRNYARFLKAMGKNKAQIAADIEKLTRAAS